MYNEKNLPLIIINVLLILIFLLHASGWLDFKLINRLEALSYDIRLNLTMLRTVDDRIVIVDIDEKSLAQVGRWPWSRDKLALLMDNLFDFYKVAVTGFDVVFPERDESSGIRVLEQIGKQELKNDRFYQQFLPGLRSKLDYNTLFARKLKGRNIVLGYSFDKNTDNAAGLLPPPSTGSAGV